MTGGVQRVETVVRTAIRRLLPQPLRDSLREVAYAVTPPLFVATIRRMRREWEFVPEGWASRAKSDADGWDVSGVVESYRAGFHRFRAAIGTTSPLGIPQEVHPGQAVRNDVPGSHNLILTYGYVLARAAAGSSRVTVLDWGGGLANYYLLGRALLPEVQLEYHCKELPAIATAGRELLPEVTFHEDDRCLERKYDLVLASGSLQYAEDWEHQLRRFADAATRFVFVARLPVSLEGASFVAMQRPYRYGYDTEYIGWVFGRTSFLRGAEGAGLRLERELIADEGWKAAGAPTATESRSYLFTPADRAASRAAEITDSTSPSDSSG